MLVTKSIGERIRDLRDDNDFKQGELAKYIGVSRQVLSNWERGYTPVDIEGVSKLAIVLKVSVDYIMRGEGDVVPNKEPEIGDRIRQLRFGKGWLQKELADKSKFTVQKISNIERGFTTEINSGDINIFAQVFNVSTDYILNPDALDQKELLQLASKLALACQQVLDSNAINISKSISLMEKALIDYNGVLYNKLA